MNKIKNTLNQIANDFNIICDKINEVDEKQIEMLSLNAYNFIKLQNQRDILIELLNVQENEEE